MTTVAPGPATRMTIYINIDDRWEHTSLVTEVVRRAHRAGLAGASVLQGIEGFGAGSFVHTDRLLDVSDGLPAVIVIVDRDENIRAFLAQLDDVIPEGLVTLDPVNVVHVAPGGDQP